MTAIESALIDQLLAGQIDLLRYEANVRARVIALLQRLQMELAAKLQTDITTFSRARIQALLKQATSTIDHYYSLTAEQVAAASAGAAETTAGQAGRALSSATVQMGVGLPTQTFLQRIAGQTILLGASSANWWKRQAQDIAFRFAAAVRQGLVQGETNEQIVARITGSPRKGITGVMDVARSNARSLVHTSIQAVANESRMETFRKNADITTGVRWLATLDSHTCLICAARDLKEYSLDEPPEPINHAMTWDGGPGVIHWGCRCVATPIMKTFKDLGMDIEEIARGGRATAGGPVRSDVTFEAFLKRQGKEYADEVLGPGRAELWRKGKLSLDQLLSMDGERALTLAQLKKRYA